MTQIKPPPKKSGRFSLPFVPTYEGEVILEKYWAEPSVEITSLLESSESYFSVMENLPKVNL